MSTKKKIGFYLLIPVLLLAALVFQAVAAPGTGFANFEIDGNTAQDIDPEPYEFDDWETVILGGEPYWDAGPGFLILDGSSGPKVPADREELNIFAKGGKFGVPEEWTIEPGNTPAQNDLTNVYAYPVLPAGPEDDHTYMVMGMERIKKQGTFDLDFEYNQVPWDGTSGTLVRTPGDVAVGFELSGNPEDPSADLLVLVLIYAPDDIDCSDWDSVYGEGWCVVYSGAGNTLGIFGEATMNVDPFDPPDWGSLQSSGAPLEVDDQIQPFFFAEAVLDLTAMEIEPGCPGFGSVHAKSRSSLEITADMKDLAGPTTLPIQCGISGHKYQDVNGDGELDGEDESNPLPDWDIKLSIWDEGTSSYKPLATDTTNFDGEFVFGNLSDGKYKVEEVCKPGWTQTVPTPPGECGTGVFENIILNVSNTSETLDFGNAIGSIIIRKEDGDGALLAGAGFTFTPNPFTGEDDLVILDGEAEVDQANGNDGILCIDNVAVGVDFLVEETTVPNGYFGDDSIPTVSAVLNSCSERLPDPYDATDLSIVPDATFTNLLGSIIIRKEDGDGALLAGAGFTFDVNPFDGGGAIEIDDGSADDQANGDDGILCIDDVRKGTYHITETKIPVGYFGDPSNEEVVVSSASTCAERLPDPYDATDPSIVPDATFTNLLGSIIIRKEAKNYTAGGVTLLGGAGFTFDVNPFDGGATIEIDDGSGVDMSSIEGILCIDNVRKGTYHITETQVPVGYFGDPSDLEVFVSSASICADRLNVDNPDLIEEDAYFLNNPLSEIVITFYSLAGDGVTVATNVSCVGEDPLVYDSEEKGPLAHNASATFTNLLEGTYTCTIVVDP